MYISKLATNCQVNQFKLFFLLITQFWIWIDVCARHDDHYPFGNYLDQNSTKQFLGSNGDIGINQPKKIELTLDLG
jgi:hypothetical protein